jgi:hypothetical protein
LWQRQGAENERKKKTAVEKGRRSRAALSD